MTKFKFRLEQVLGHRRQEEKKAEEALALARREYLHIVDLIEHARQLQQESLHAVSSTGKIDLMQALHNTCYREQLAAKMACLQRKMDLAAKKVEQKQKQLVEARKKSLILDNLKQKQWQEFVYWEHIQEQKLLDELALTTFIRNRT